MDKHTSLTYICKMKYFEWDENKRAANLAKHKIDFIDAVKVFADHDRIEFDSIRDEERRYQTIGIIDHGIVILLVYTYRKAKRRIISARRAGKKERSAYYDLR